MGRSGLLHLMRAGHAVPTIQGQHIVEAWGLLAQCVTASTLGGLGTRTSDAAQFVRRLAPPGRTVLLSSHPLDVV